MIVSENISNFKRGLNSKRSLGIGVVPVIFVPQLDWDNPKLYPYKNDSNYLDNSVIYPVYLLPKGIAGDEVIELFFGAENDPQLIDDHTRWTEIIGGIWENIWGDQHFSILKINKEEWGNFEISDLKVFGPSGKEAEVVDRRPTQKI